MNKWIVVKEIVLVIFLFLTYIAKGQTNQFQEAVETTQQLKTTSSLDLDEKRTQLIKKIQVYSEGLNDITFKDEYLNGTEANAIAMENSVPILYYYRDAFDTVLDDLQNTEQPKDSVTIWFLYNMGVIVRTPSGCYGIDVNHRWADQLEPYLDFICVSHNHNDHTSSTLMTTMRNKGKPIISNFYTSDDRYCSTNSATYQIGNFSIRTDVTDHDINLLNFVTVFRVESDGFSILHCGDSNFVPNQYVNTRGKVNLLIFFNTESVIGNQIISPDIISPDYVALSHFIELRHKIYVSPRRYPLTSGLNAIPIINCENTILPMWGEKLSWPAESQFQGGTGTQEDPYLISTPKHLENMRRYTAVNSISNNNKPVKYFKLTSDIDLSSIPNWLPLSFNLGGTNQGYAYMHLDGDGHVIKNMTSIYPGTGTSEYWGFAGILCGSIKNLGLINVNVSCTNYPGAIAGAVGRTTPTAGLENLQRGSVENCFVTGKVTGTGKAGGITGQIGNKGSFVKNCYSTCDVTNTGNTATAYTGGIVGAVIGNAANNTIAVSYVENCFATGNIKGEKGFVGGIAGGVLGGNISNCVAYNQSIIMNDGSLNNSIGTLTADIDAVSYALMTNSDNFLAKDSIKMLRGETPYNPSNFDVMSGKPLDGIVKDFTYLSDRSNYQYLDNLIWADDLANAIFPQLLWVSLRADAAEIDGLQLTTGEMGVEQTYISDNNIKTSITPSGILSLQTNEIIRNVSIYSLQGHSLFDKDFQEHLVHVDLSLYPSAVYLVNIITSENISRLKILKK